MSAQSPERRDAAASDNRPAVNPSTPPDHIVHRSDTGRWLLMTNQRTRVRVNGQTIHLGVRVLDSGDLIQSDCDVSPFTPAVSATRAPHTGAAINCARCTMPIEPGVTAARCACGALHHDAADWRCWSDFSTCALCSAPVEAAGEGA